jgi:flagellar basal body rod protein FlgG
MDALTISAASGLRARMESLELIANNLANSGTAGYKADREFYNLYLAPEAEGVSFATTLPVIEQPWTDLSQGILRATGNPTDLGLSGDGFFVVDGPSAPLYTRNGHFRLSAAGDLVTEEGYRLRTVDQRPLRARAELPLEISGDGTVRQQGQVLGRIRLTGLPQAATLVKEGRNYLRAATAAAPEAAAPEVHQGKLEDSNVGAAESAVRLVSVMRQFEMLQRAIALGGEMNRKAAEEVARVNS